MSGSLVESVGFKAMIVGMGVICFLYAPLLFWLKEQFALEDQYICPQGFVLICSPSHH